MKLVKKILRTTTLSVVLFICSCFNVKAATTYSGKIEASEYVSKTYVKMEKSSGYAKYLQVQFIRRSSDNEFVYCIQPFVSVVDDTYKVTYADYLSVIGMTEEQWERINLLAYYGYKYGTHTEAKWYAITQLLIWRTVEPNVEIYFTAKLNGTRDDSIYQSEINELETLVSNHKKKPSFDINVDTLNVGASVTLIDKNNVLKDFSVSYSDNIRIEVSNNQLKLTALKPGKSEIKLSKIDTKYNTQPALYYADISQAVIRVGSYDPVSLKLNLNVIGGKVTLKKVDSQSLTNIPSGEATLENAEYGIYDSNNQLVETLITSSDGTAQSNYLPHIGEYTIKELNSPKGYKIDDIIYHFEITEESLNPEIIVYEQVIKSKIEIYKYFANGETGSLIPESNVQFNIYDNNNDLVVEVTTDKKGYSSFELPYGTYKVKQVSATPGYEKIKNFTIVVNENSDDVITYSFSDARISARLKVVKIDADSNKQILMSNIKFKIKNIDTNEYVCQTINYPKTEKICEYLTNENGEFITPELLLSGTYQLEEIEAPNGYVLNQESLIFRIDNESNIIKDNTFGKYIEIKFANKKKKSQIIIEKTGDLFCIYNSNFLYKDIALENVEFTLYANEDIISKDGIIHYKKGEEISIVKTNINGIAIFDDLILGSYIVKETKSLDGYLLEEKKYYVELVDDKNTEKISYDLKIVNELEKGNVIFSKTDFVTGDAIPNTKIELYTEFDELIYSGITDENGEIVINKLKKGKYYFIEVEPATGYVITDEKVYFEITENNEIIKSEMTNRPITGSLIFSKIDFSTSEPLPNTLIEIYTDKDELVYSGRTNENGEITIEELRYGKYYIVEKEAPDGYLLNSSKMYFEIKEDGEVVKTIMTNERVIVEVPDTFQSDKHIVEIIGILFITLGIGGIIYAKRKAYKK